MRVDRRFTGGNRPNVLVVGGGLGGVAAALSVARMGGTVVVTEATDWLGGQATSQAVPFDEHPWIEETGCTATYRRLRNGVRDYYRHHYPLLPGPRVDPQLNPGMGFSTRVCFEPRVGHLVIMELLAPYLASGAIRLLLEHEPVSVDSDGDRVRSVTLRSTKTGGEITIESDTVIDATELGDLLELGGVEHVIGAESRAETGELHALETADPLDQQATTWCFAVDYFPDEDHTIDRPEDYDYWKSYQADFWPGPQLGWTVSEAITRKPYHQPLFAGDRGDRVVNDLWHYRRLFYTGHYPAGMFPSDVTVVKWAANDYWDKPLLGVSAEAKAASLRGAKQLSLSLLYWMQTEAPRHDDGHGYPGLRLRHDVMDTEDGLAKHVYVREARRIKAEFTVAEQHIGVEARPGATGAEPFFDTVGVGAARIDLHPSTSQRNYVDVDSWPFQIPLGSLLPQRIENLLPACKNIGSTHLTNGSYRWHHVEWNIGEAVGALAAFAQENRVPPRAVRNTPSLLTEFQSLLVNKLGLQLEWPRITALGPAQRFGSPSAIHGGNWLAETGDDGFVAKGRL